MAVAFYFLMMPNGFVLGGVGGLGIILGRLTTFSVGTWLTGLNVLLLIIGFIALGKSVGIKTVFCTLLYSGMIDILEKFVPLKMPLTDQPFLELCCAILVAGIGQAMIFHADASSGGTDILALILRKYTHTNVGRALLYVDIVICVSAFFAIDVRAGLFSVLGLVAVTFIIDNALESFTSCKYFIIITDKPDEISEFILTDMDHSATLVRGEGIYSHGEKAMLHTVCRRREALRLQRFIKQADPNAFTIITTSSEIIGSGFREN
ncbi:MAG: YitT family protein [Firmicutes bacterium]|nr:YitT family protein [Bacillota bacterium]